MNKCCLWIVQLWRCIRAIGGPDYRLCQSCILRVQAMIVQCTGTAAAYPWRRGGVQNSEFVKSDIVLPLVLGFVAVGVVPIRGPRPPWMRISVV